MGGTNFSSVIPEVRLWFDSSALLTTALVAHRWLWLWFLRSRDWYVNVITWPTETKTVSPHSNFRLNHYNCCLHYEHVLSLITPLWLRCRLTTWIMCLKKWIKKWNSKGLARWSDMCWRPGCRITGHLKMEVKLVLCERRVRIRYRCHVSV